MSELTDRIAELRRAAASLEPDAGARATLGAQALDHALGFLARVPDAPSFVPPAQAFAERLDPEFAEAGRDPAQVLAYLAQCVDAPGFATTSPRFMGYIPGGGLFHAALGDLLAATANMPGSPG